MAKTIKVTDLIQWANKVFVESPDDARMERINLQAMVETWLHKTGNYAGFGYVKPYGEPGCDSSRIFFYVSRKL